MFCVFNKQKIYSYIVATSTVVVLFIVAAFFTNDKVDTIEASSNINVPSITNDINTINEVESLNKSE